MKSIVKLKEQARAFEQKEEWERAIETYREVLRLGEEQEGEMELALFNKVGDLYLRLGRSDDAVQRYQEAADRYADAGLYNNAIALCNKALRYAPDQVEVYRRLGRFCAAQGFIADARRWILEYAEKMNTAGRREAAFGALEEFAELTSDPEIAEMLGRQLHLHGRTSDAVVQLRRAFRQYQEADRYDRAEAVRAAFSTIAPGEDIEDDGDYTSAAPEALPGYDDDPEEDRPAPPSDDLKVESVAEAAGLPPEQVSQPRSHPDIAPESEAELEPERMPEPLADGDVDAFGMIDLSAGSADEPAPSSAPDGNPDAFGVVDLDSTEADSAEPEPLPLLDESEDEEEPDPLPLLGEDEDEPEPLPLLSSDADGPDADASDPLPDLEPPRLDEQPAAEVPHAVDAEAARNRARQVLARGDRRGALSQLESLHETLVQEGQLVEALDVVSEMISIDPGDIRHYQLKVEYASRTGEDAPLVGSYLELAGALERRGASTKAMAVLQRVLDLEPGNEQARAALYGGESARSREFVDLTAFLTEDEADPRESTRFVVAAQAPTGDDEADLAQMLSQFRAKVADNVGVEDASSHYDLGLAFKEMGLIDEAINEFQTAMRGGEERLKVYEELGHCFVLKGQYNVAVKVLSRALHLPREADTELLGVYYHLGRSYEELGQRDDAREAYERVVGIHMDFRDVPQRLARL